MQAAEPLIEAQNALGESPVWDENEGVLYWLDIPECRLYTYHPTTGAASGVTLAGSASALALRQGRGLLLSMNDAFVTADTSGVVTGLTARVELAPGQHFNDGAVDARGRYWSATLDTGRTPINCLYRLDATGALQVMDEGLRAGNGIAWSPDDRTKHLNKSFCEILRAKSHNLPRARGAAFTISFAWVLMYLVDSGPRVIYAYDFDLASGFVSNRRELVRSLEPSSVPDGIAVDSEGYIWCAHWGGWKVVRYDPAGEVEREVTLSVQYPSSCTFGGANLDELFITSSCIRLDPEEKKKQPHAGDVFHLKTHTRGLSTSRFAG